jgi:hypothetical protein
MTSNSSNSHQQIDFLIQDMQLLLDHFSSRLYIAHLTPVIMAAMEGHLVSLGFGHRSQELRITYSTTSQSHYASNTPLARPIRTIENRNIVRVGFDGPSDPSLSLAADLMTTEISVHMQSNSLLFEDMVPQTALTDIPSSVMTLVIDHPLILSSLDRSPVSGLTGLPLQANALSPQQYLASKATGLLQRFGDNLRRQLCDNITQLEKVKTHLSSHEIEESLRALREKENSCDSGVLPANLLSRLQQLLDKVGSEGTQAIKILEASLLNYCGNTFESLDKVTEKLFLHLQNGNRFYDELDAASLFTWPPEPSKNPVLLSRAADSSRGEREYLAGFCGKKKCTSCDIKRWRSLQNTFECILPWICEEALWICLAW